MKSIRFFLVTAFLTLFSLGQLSAQSPVYGTPPGGWTYFYNGSWTTTADPFAGPDTGGSKSPVTLDGTWNGNNGSSEWDGRGRGPGTGATGGISSTNGILTIEDINNGAGTLNNRKVYFTRDFIQDAGTTNAAKIVDNGITISFRTRLTPQAVVPAADNLALPDGWGIFSDGKGHFNVRQSNPSSIIGLSLVRASEPDNGFVFPAAGLTMNRLNGNAPSANVDSGDAAGGTTNVLALDPNVFHEFWITIQTNRTGGAGTHTIDIYYDGSLTPTTFNVTAGTGSEFNTNYLGMGLNNSGGSGCVDIDFYSYRQGLWTPVLARDTNAPPVITSKSPTNNATFQLAAGGLNVTAATFSPNTIAASSSAVRLFLNGIEVSGALMFGGDDTNRTASYAGLAENILYTATVIVSDQMGRKSTNTWKFDTFTAAGNVVIETEDYNYDSGADGCNLPATRITSGTGGAFLDNPAPGAYANLLGLPNIDYFVTAANRSTYYRCSADTTNAVGTRISQDSTRTEYVMAALPEVDVWQMQPNEWMNYSRTFGGGNYQVYLRVSATAAQQMRLDRVTSDPTTTGQTTTPIGFFNVPNTGGSTTYCMIPLQDALGTNTLASLTAGVNTLRLTALGANNNVQPNFLVFIPSAAMLPPTVASVVPANNATGVLPDAVVKITLADGDTTVNTNTITLRFDGSDVTGALQISRSGSQVLVCYDPPGLLSSNTLHTISLAFADSGSTVFSNNFSFTTIPFIRILPACYATAPGSGSDAGFDLKVRKAPNASPVGSFPNSIARAEQHLADLLVDPNTGLPFVNEAAPGTFTETGVINYEQGALSAGAFHSTNGYPEAAFPGIPAGTPDFISLEAVAYLELTAGFHRFGVRSDDGFQLTAGPVGTDTNLILGLFDGGRGDSPSEFDFFAEAAGLYAFRLIYLEGQGGASLEFYSVDPVSNARTLINDAAVMTSVKAWRTRTGTPPCTPPVLSNIQPANNTFGHPAASGLSFDATAAPGNSIAPADVHLTLNGVDVSGSLAIGGTPGARTASFSGLIANRVYTALISTTDSNGRSAGAIIRFDTFVAADVTVIEAEDYNYDSTADPCDVAMPIISGAGGAFIDNPAPAGYFGFRGLTNIDFSDTSALNPAFNVYRSCNEAGTKLSLDTTRPAYVTAGTNEFEVWKMQPGEWLNYTRTFPAGCYYVYLRVSSSAARTLRLDHVGGDPTSASQTTFPRGTFRVPNTGGATSYRYVQLTDALNAPVTVGLSGVQTLRVASVDAADDVQANYLVFVPADIANSGVLTSISPAPGVTGVSPAASIDVSVAGGCVTLYPAWLHLYVNGAEVTAETAITPGPFGATLSYLPPKLLNLGAAYGVAVGYHDPNGPVVAYPTQWVFTVTSANVGTAVKVNFAAGAGNSAGNPVAPTPAGYVQDIGETFANRGNGSTYGWDRNIVVDGRYRQAANSPDLRYDTFMHMIKATPPAIWEIALPNGPYQVRVVGGDPANVDSIIQYDVEGVVTASYTPVAPNNWGDHTVNCTVADGRLTLKSGPASQTTANNNKVSFIDITPLNVVIAPVVSRQPQGTNVVLGGTATFVVCVRGTGPLSYQWRRNGTPIANATNDTLTLTGLACADGGAISVVVTNSSGTATSLDATLTVIDNVAPVMSCSTNITVACSSPAGAPVSFTSSALDNCDGSVAVTCTPPSGHTFTLGVTTVNCKANDASGNTNTCSFTVTVQDQTVAQLSITQQGTNVLICWPQSCTPYVLEGTAALTTPVPPTWADVAPPATIAVNGGNFCATIPMGSTNTFFRLRYP